jgi:hypothetical protein
MSLTSPPCFGVGCFCISIIDFMIKKNLVSLQPSGSIAFKTFYINKQPIVEERVTFDTGSTVANKLACQCIPMKEWVRRLRKSDQLA